MAGLFLFAVISLVVVLQGFPAVDESIQRTLQLVCILVSILSVLTGFNIFKKRILAARISNVPGEKRMEQYRKACVIWWAMIEAPGLLAGIGFLLSGNFSFFALAVVHVLILLAFTPRKANIILFLNLNSKEVAHLQGEDNKQPSIHH
jgi:hypothetical protein